MYSLRSRLSSLSSAFIRNMSSHIPKRLENKVAVVTASTEGIGFAIAERLGKEGAKVVVSSRKQANVDKAVEKLKSQGSTAVGTVCHVAKASDREKLVKTALDNFGGIDILVSNAAVNPTFGTMFDCSEEAWDKIFEVNVKSSFFLAKAVVPHMQARGGGSIVFVTSIAAFVPIDVLGAYSVSKTALLGLVKVCASELGADNIRVNGVAPGIVPTKFSSAITESDAATESLLETVPLKRLGKPEEIAGGVAYLVSDDASYVTGETLIISGGMKSRL